MITHAQELGDVLEKNESGNQSVYTEIIVHNATIIVVAVQTDFTNRWQPGHNLGKRQYATPIHIESFSATSIAAYLL